MCFTILNNMLSHKQPKADKEKGSAGWGSTPTPHVIQTARGVGSSPTQCYPFSLSALGCL